VGDAGGYDGSESGGSNSTSVYDAPYQAFFAQADNLSDISDISVRYRVIYVGNSRINS
jgi:hypothetical protein